MKAILKIDNKKYSGFEDLEISSSMNSLCQDFSFKASDYPFEEAKNINAGKSVKVSLETDFMEHILITGYIDISTKKKNSQSGVSLDFSGRSKTCDIVDCAGLYKTNNWTKSTISQICKDICKPFGIKVTLMTVDKIVESFAIQSGETSFESIERLCRAFAILPSTNEFGGLQLSSLGSGKADSDIVVGKNVEDIEIEENHTNRFSEYHIKGQGKGNGNQWSNNTIGLKGIANDNGIERYKPIILIAENKMNDSEIQNRANWECQIRAGRSITVKVEWPGWTQDPFSEYSRPWKINEIARVVDEQWGIDSNMLVCDVTLKAESNGKKTNLTLVPIETFKPNPTDKVQLSKKSTMRIGNV